MRMIFVCESEPAIQLFACPICGKFVLTSENPLENEWVALGSVVCSEPCYEKAYELMRERQHETPVYHTQPP